MLDFLTFMWPHLVAALYVLIGTVAAIHAAMNKDEVRGAIGWVGVIILSPLLGALIYGLVGINLMRRSSVGRRRARAHEAVRQPLEEATYSYELSRSQVVERFGQELGAMYSVGESVTPNSLTDGNDIELLEGGDAAYTAMLEAIDSARRSIFLETYIFDHDEIGLQIADALVAAQGRGVSVRVLIDGVGARYSRPPIMNHLRRRGVRCALFNSRIVGLRMPYANLRTHRKILTVDGRIAFAGGMNIRESFTASVMGERAMGDTHFRLTGPVVRQLFAVAAEDWLFTTREELSGDEWRTTPATAGGSGQPGLCARVVASGPDQSLRATHAMLMGALSIARKRVLIASPYFLPDQQLIGALVTAARRGVEVDILIPSKNNLALVDRAMTAQLDQVLKGGCRVWRMAATFDHSKLISIDGCWAYVGSSNLDPRSLRLNFEVDVEIMNVPLARLIEDMLRARRERAWPETLDSLKAKPFLARLRNRLVWLASPYL